MPKDVCPYCQSAKTIGDSAPVAALAGDADIEQLCVCLNCHRSFVSLYVLLRNAKLPASSVFTSDDQED